MSSLEPDWQPPEIGGPLTVEEVLRTHAHQIKINTRMNAHLAAEIEKHERWHDKQEAAELRQLRAERDAARKALEQQTAATVAANLSRRQFRISQLVAAAAVLVALLTALLPYLLH